MWINIIDYRGDQSTVNSRGDTLFDYRTKYFLRQQEDFHYWKKAGHKFRCFSQHENRNPLFDDYSEYDDVIKIPRSNAAQARNHVLNFYPKEEWIGIWDNDATLYFDKLESRRFTVELEQVCAQAQKQGIICFIPFNAQQAPYPKNPKSAWTFKPKLEQKGTMIFLQVWDWRFDESMDALEDLEFACSLIDQGYKFAQCEQVSLKEMVHGKSTIFEINAHHKEYKKPGPNANPNGLLEWDAQIDRANKYKKNINYIEMKLGKNIKTLREQHKKLWK
jgi:hypothetical protein